MKKNLDFYLTAQKEGVILSDVIMLTQADEGLNTDVLVMDFGKLKGVIKREDVDFQVNWKSLVGFIGRKVYFVVKEVDAEKGIVLCSRKEAQERMYPEVVEKLTNSEEVDACITGIVKYGAYVEISGIYALLKNSDFSDDHVPVGDVLREGDVIKVRLKRINDGDKIAVEAVNKYILESVMRFDSFQRDQVVLGTVNGVKPWGAYVTIAPGLDALCPIPETGEVEEGTKVSFRITQVKEEEKRIRGKILRIIQ